VPGITFIASNQITLNMTRAGRDDGLPLVFINSLGSDLRIWDGVVPHLVDHAGLIRYDKRGHGLSDCPPAPYSIRDHTEDLHGLLELIGITEAVLIGISVGGMIALDFAITYPEQVKALILCDTAAKIGTSEMWNERIDTLRAHGMAHLGDAILTRWFTPSFLENQPAAARGYYNMLTRMPVTGYTGTCEALRDADLREAVATIQAKALVLCGAEDASTPPDLVRGLAESLPDARFALLEGAGHLPCIEQPAKMATIIREFLEENGYVR